MNFTKTTKTIFDGEGEIITFNSQKVNEDLTQVYAETKNDIIDELKKRLEIKNNWKIYIETSSIARLPHFTQMKMIEKMT